MIFIGVGSNLKSKFGDRQENINLAISLLEKNQIKLLKKSSFYETFSQPNKKDPKFLNVIISVKTSLSPVDLMLTLLSVEKQIGRERKIKNEPRICDLDIIDYNGLVGEYKIYDNNLTLPHKSLIYRNFVLYPLKEISFNWIHPKSKKIIDDLIKTIESTNNEITKFTENDINAHVK